MGSLVDHFVETLKRYTLQYQHLSILVLDEPDVCDSSLIYYAGRCVVIKLNNQLDECFCCEGKLQLNGECGLEVSSRPDAACWK